MADPIDFKAATKFQAHLFLLSRSMEAGLDVKVFVYPDTGYRVPDTKAWPVRRWTKPILDCYVVVAQGLLPMPMPTG